MPWWLGALALASTALVHLVLVRRGLGVSGAVNAVLRGREPHEGVAQAVLDQALVDATGAHFGNLIVDETAASTGPVLAPAVGWSRNVAFLVGCVLGGTLFSVLFTHPLAVGGGIELAPGGVYARLFQAGVWPALFVGGVFVGVGTSMAGGCTSGHGLVGCGRLQVPSFIATACFFGTPIALALVARALFLGGGP